MISHFLYLLLPFLVTATPTVRQATCTPLCSDDQYCSAGICMPIDFTALVSTSGAPHLAGPGDFSLIMASDIQFYFLKCKDEPFTECIYSGVADRARLKKNLLTDATARQISCIDHLNAQLGAIAVFNNGDVTNTAAESELNEVKKEFDERIRGEIGLPLAVVLGNHDYGNPKFGSKSERAAMTSYLADEIIRLATTVTLRSIDFDRSVVFFNDETGRMERRNRGSLCYAIEIHDYVFIVLHWAVAINGGVWTEETEVGTGSFWDMYSIRSVEGYLSAELGAATAEGKKIVLVPHSWRGLEKFVSRVPSMQDEFRDANIVAVVSGHDHDQWGFYRDWQVGSASPRSIPVYYSGSASYEKLVTFEVSGGGFAVKSYDTKLNPCKQTADNNSDP